MEPARGGEVEKPRAAADLEDDGGEGGHAGGLLGDPQRIEQLRRFGKQQLLRLDAEQGVKTPCIGKAGLVENFRRADPQDRQALLLLEDQAYERERKAGDAAGIAGLQAVDFAERRLGQAAAKGGVEAIDAGMQEGVRRGHGEATPDKCHVRSAGIDRCAGRRRFKALGQRSFDLRDLAAQGKNSVPRHGAHRHDVHFRQQLFLLCSYRFQRASEESSGVTRNLFLHSLPSGKSASWLICLYRRESLYAGIKGHFMARIYKTRTWHDQLSPSMDEMELLALESYAHLPDEFRQLTGEIIIQIAEFPTDEIMDDLSLETPFDLLGLFEGRGIAERWNPQTGEGPNRITLYRRAILDYWAENEETLGDIVTHVLIHEIGHHFGLSDDDMERIEEAAEQVAPG